MKAERLTAAQKATLIRRACGLCEYCRSPAACSTDPYVGEHIKPKVRGGKTSLKNLAYACSGCNGHKHAKVKAIDPVKPSWCGFSIRAVKFGNSTLPGTKITPGSSA